MTSFIYFKNMKKSYYLASLSIITLLLSLVPSIFAQGITPNGVTQKVGEHESRLTKSRILILWDGIKNITEPQPAEKVIVGERINLTVTLPAGLTGPTTYQWDIQGERIKDYTEIQGNGTIHNKGEKFELKPEDLQINNPHFYWYNGSFTGQPEVVSVTISNNGDSITVKSNFIVYTPDLVSFTGKYNDTSIKPVAYMSDLDLIQFSPDGPGIKFSASVKVPDIPTASGEIGFEQLSSIDDKFKMSDGTTNHYEREIDPDNNGGPAIDLDSQDEDARYHLEVDGIGTDFPALVDPNDPNKKTVSISTSDTPRSEQPKDEDISEGWKQDFHMYVMYNPHTINSIWVPLGKLDWGWSFKAEKRREERTRENGTKYTVQYWHVISYAPQHGDTAPPSVKWHDLFEWKTKSQDIPRLPYTPNPAW